MARDSLGAMVEEDKTSITISVNGSNGYFIGRDGRQYETEYLTMYEGLESILAPKPLVEWSN